MTPRSRTAVFASVNNPSATPSSSSAARTGTGDERNMNATTKTILEDDGKVEDEADAIQSSSLDGEADDAQDQAGSSSSSASKHRSPFEKFKYRDDGRLQAQSGNNDAIAAKRQRITRPNPSASSSSLSASAGQVALGDKSDQVMTLTPVKKTLSPSRKSPSKSSKPTSFYPTKAILSSNEAYCAPPPYKYRCRFKSTCDECFHASLQCAHTEEAPLKLLLIGHNPSVRPQKGSKY